MAADEPDLWVDRLTARPVAPGTEPALSGRFLSGGKYLLPGGFGQRSLPGGFRPTALPDEVTLSSVLTIAGAALATPLEDWRRISPLVPNQHKALEADDLDRAIDQDLPALCAVCTRPHDRLGVAEEVVPPGRARRIPPAALTHLAAHSEDWLARDHTGITPARVLTVLFVEELDFYENRLAAKLVDHLRTRVAERIRRIRSIARQMDDIRRYRDELTNRPSYRNLQRMAQLLADQANVDLQSTTANATLDVLARLDRSLAALRASLLYRSVNRRAPLSVSVRSTNLLRDDHRYHRVAELWRSWARHQLCMAEAQARMDGFTSAFETFVGFLLIRAADYLNLRPPASSSLPAMPGASVELTGRDEPVYLTLTEHRTFLVRRGDQSLATFVPLAHALTRDKSSNAVRRNVQDVLSAVVTAHTPTVVVYPGLVEERQDLTGAAIRTLAYPAGPAGTRSALGVIPVSPLDINSIERLARALRWALYGLPSLDYPPVVAMPARAAAEFGAELPNLAPRDGGVAVRCAFTRTEQEALETGVRRIAAEDTRLGRGADELTRVHAELLAAHRALRALGTCPICGTDADRKFEPRGGATFQCECSSPSCETVWGTRICGQCHERFPVLSFGLRQATVTTGDDLDRFFGNEVLAVPCPGLSQDEAGQQFRCPWCAHCPHHRADPCTVPVSTIR